MLRISGPAAVEVAGRVFRGRVRPVGARARVQYFGSVIDAAGSVVDQVLLTVFRAPASYTGEDLVEIGCHGGILVTGRVLELVLANGARAAEPGEFTQRAFLNGKMDLTQAEAVMDLISAQTSLALRAANEQLEGRLGSRVLQVREDLLNVLAHIEAHIDFPEEDISPETGALMAERMNVLLVQVGELLATADRGRVLREGVRTVICGAPNVGKSSLLNLLLGFDRAIVSSEAGTTRDTIEETIQIRGLPLRLIDTAGMREAFDAVEQEGIQRARKQLARADLVLEVVDASQPPQERLRIPLHGGARHLVILNKADLGIHAGWEGVRGAVISCTENTGVEALGDSVFDLVAGDLRDSSASLVAINARHQGCLARARAGIAAALEALEAGESPEFIALEIRSALDAIGEVVGMVDADELLGVIFASFCIGK